MAIADNLLASYSMDEASGDTVANDTGASEYDGVATGSTIIDSPLGKARQFANDNTPDSPPSDYIIIPGGVIRNVEELSSNFSLEIWARFQSIPTYQAVFNNNNSSGQSGLNINVQDNGRVDAFVNLTGTYAFPPSGSNYQVVQSSVGAIVTDQMYQIGFSYDGANMKLYINGALVSTRVTTPDGDQIYWNGLDYHATDIQIGRASADQYVIMHPHFYTKYLRMWNKTVEAGEFSWLYNSGSARTYADILAGISGGGGEETVAAPRRMVMSVAEM